MYEIRFTKKSLKDLALIQRGRKSILKKIEGLLDVIELNPYQNPPPYEKMIGYSNRYSRRVNVQHRIVYEIYDNIIKIISLWTHYE